MSYLFTALVFAKNGLRDRALLDAIAITEEDFPKPHPYPSERYVRVPVARGVEAIFYLIGGYSTKSECWSAQRERFQEDSFPRIVSAVAGKEYRFYSVLYNDMDLDYGGVVERYMPGRWESRQVLDGRGHRYVEARDGSIEEESAPLAKAKPATVAKFDPGVFLRDELGVSFDDLIEALMALDERGVELARFPRAAKKPTAKKPVPKKPAAKKPVPKKPAAKKPVPKKPAKTQRSR